MATIPNERTPRQIERGINTPPSASWLLRAACRANATCPCQAVRGIPSACLTSLEVSVMGTAQIGSARSTGGGAAKWVFAAIVAVVIVVVAAYFILAGSGGPYSPSGTYAPGTN